MGVPPLFLLRTVIRLLIALAFLVPFSMAPAGCGSGSDEPRKVSLKPAEETLPARGPAAGQQPPGQKKLRVAIAAMISPKETFASYKQLMSWIARKSGMEVEFIQRKKYEEVNDLLEKEQIDLAFVCTGAYVDGHDDFGMELLAVPVTHGKSVYYSYTIVPSDSPARQFGDLKGKTFAFTDPMSNTGKLAPTYQLARIGQTPDTFFKSTTYTYSHDKSIESVSRRLVDGAAVDSLVYDYLERKTPEFTSGTRIIGKSDPYGIPPVVVSRGAPPEMKNRLRELFLRAHEDPEGKSILSGIMIERFVAGDDAIYDSVRAMKKWVDGNARK